MLRTTLCPQLVMEYPLFSAGMGGAMAGPELVAAVSNAGACGVLGMGGLPAPYIRQQIQQMRTLTNKPFGVNFLLPLLEEGQIDTCFDAQVPILVLFWGDPAPYIVQDVTVVPKPLQKPHPKLYMVGTSESSFIAAGTRGLSIVAGGPVPYSVYAPGINGYKRACAVRGYTPDISFIRLVYLDEDGRQVRREAERYVRNFLDFNASAIDSLAPYTKELKASGYGFYTSGVAEKFRALTYDQCLEEELCFLGAPEQVVAQIRRLDQQIGGLDEMVISSNFGGIEDWKATKTQHLFAQYVMPALREEREL